MVKKLTIAIAAICISVTSIGQEETETYIEEGLFRAAGTFSYGFMNDNVQNNYLSGLLEYYVDEKISLRGDGVYFLGHQSDFQPLTLNHQLFAGAYYHSTRKNPKLDPYFGLAPGLAYSQRNEQILAQDSTITTSEPAYSPLLGITGGVNYYSGKFFHFFIEARFVRGVHLSNGTPKFLDEFRLSFGLGWDLKFK